MVQEAELLRKIVEEESDVCELDEGRCVSWGEIADMGRVSPNTKIWLRCSLPVSQREVFQGKRTTRPQR